MRLRALALAALLAVVPATTRAQATLTFASSLANPVASGVYVGPYGGATFVDAIGQARTVSVLCVDYLNEVYFGDRYQIAATNLGDPVGPLLATRHPADLLTYRKAAWLGAQFASTPTSDWGSLHDAVWNLFTPAQAPDDAKSATYLALADQAAAHDFEAFDTVDSHFAAVDMSNYWVLTDVSAASRALGGKQEFITGDIPAPLATVPEAGTLLLAASGLAPLGIIAVRRRRASAERRA